MKITFINPNFSKQTSSDAMEPIVYAILSRFTPDNIEKTLKLITFFGLSSLDEVKSIFWEKQERSMGRRYNRLRKWSFLFGVLPLLPQ